MNNRNNSNLLPALEQTLLYIQDWLSKFTDQPDSEQKIKFIFGTQIDVLYAKSLIQSLTQPNSTVLPKIEIRSSVEINGARGAFAGRNNTIYLAQEFIEKNVNNVTEIASVLIEEIGHFVDFQLNSTDMLGDEGELFSDLVRGVAVSEGELQRLKTEDDTAIVTIHGQILEIEQAGTTFINLANPVGITIDTQGNFVVNSDNSVNFIISKISPDRRLLQQA